MKYNSYNAAVPFENRSAVNEKLVALVQTSNLQTITAEEVFNLFTGKGHLHGLQRNDYDNYYDYSVAKKEVEQGQFFTPHNLCNAIVQAVKPPASWKIADLTCGMGNFFNYLPTEKNCYGVELDCDAFNICRFLFPDANLHKGDFIYWQPTDLMDLVIGNPPFNLKTDIGVSQFAYLVKAAEVLQPDGLLTVIVPESFLSDEITDSRKIAWVNETFSFICQALLPADSFPVLIHTKLLILQKKGVLTGGRAFQPAQYESFEPASIYEQFIQPIQRAYQEASSKRHLFLVKQNVADQNLQYEIRKRLWHIKENPRLQSKYYGKALAKLDQLATQKKPDDCSDKEWERIKLTPARVWRWLNTIVRQQNRPAPQKITRLVKTSYGIKNKAYHKSLESEAWEKSVHDCLLEGEQPAGFEKLYRKKAAQLSLQNTSFKILVRNVSIDHFLTHIPLVPTTKPGELFAEEAPTITLTPLQVNDLGLVFQKKYSLLAWQQGIGKSVAGMFWMLYHQSRYKHCFLVAPALAIHGTWKERLRTYGFDYILLESISDIAKIRPGQTILLTYDACVSLQRFVKRFIKCCSYKIALLVDESDELTNPHSQRSLAVLNCFRKAKFKLLTTGTTTRNHIGELYTQLELLYNNSTALTCWPDEIYQLGKDNNLKTIPNTNKGYPFPAYTGNALFKAAFCPHRKTVFGINKELQDIYNADHLKELIDKTIVTRKFEEVVGEKKYSIHQHSVLQSQPETELYQLLLKDFLSICYAYYTSTGNARKEAALRLMRQIKVLIKASSIPHLMPHYKGEPVTSKYKEIERLCALWSNERITIGTTLKDAAKDYLQYVGKAFPYRKCLYIDGEASFATRRKILLSFKADPTAILICTQQSLKSSVNIPYCNKCIIESLQWNIPKISQFFFRFIRFDSTRHTEVHFVTYENTIEMNLLALLMAKEKLNDFVKTTNETTSKAIYDEFGIDLNILEMLIEKNYDADGKLVLNWGKQRIE